MIKLCEVCGTEFKPKYYNRVVRTCSQGCRNKLNAITRRALAASKIEKKCSKCGEVKPMDEFHRRNSSPDGRHYQCKACALADAKKNGRGRSLKSRYGIDEAGRLSIYESQNGACTLCGKELSLGKSVIDHDHSTGKLRSILCHPCNVGLGLFGDSPDRLRAAADYIEFHRTESPHVAA